MTEIRAKEMREVTVAIAVVCDGCEIRLDNEENPPGRPDWAQDGVLSDADFSHEAKLSAEQATCNEIDTTHSQSLALDLCPSCLSRVLSELGKIRAENGMPKLEWVI